jgi:hypothetical protein
MTADEWAEVDGLPGRVTAAPLSARKHLPPCTCPRRNSCDACRSPLGERLSCFRRLRALINVAGGVTRSAKKCLDDFGSGVLYAPGRATTPGWSLENAR